MDLFLKEITVFVTIGNAIYYKLLFTITLILVISGPNVLDEHCIIENQDGYVVLYPFTDAACTVNGMPVRKKTKLQQGNSLICFLYVGFYIVLIRPTVFIIFWLCNICSRGTLGQWTHSSTLSKKESFQRSWSFRIFFKLVNFQICQKLPITFSWSFVESFRKLRCTFNIVPHF